MSLTRERLLYEIAMSIGNSRDLAPMLKECLPTYLRKLNLLAGAVLRTRPDDEGVSHEVAFTIPKRMSRNSAFSAAIDAVPGRLSHMEQSDFMASLPASGMVMGYQYTIMELPGFGLLLLLKASPGLTVEEIKSLAPINAKLAGACVSCVINEQLAREIAEREKAEAMYRNIVDNALDGIYRSRLDGSYIHVNPALARIFGYGSPQEMMDQVDDVSMMHYVYPEDRQRFIQLLQQDGQVNWFEFEYRRTDGQTGWISTSARLVSDEDGAAPYVEGTSRDITQGKLAEAALREAKIEAERLSQLKTNVINTVSHELRTPMTSILGFAKIIKRRLDQLSVQAERKDHKSSKFFKQICDNARVIIVEGERLTELINNVLDLAKLEAGQYDWNMESVSIADVLHHSLATSDVLFGETGVELMQDIPDDLPNVVGDHDRLIQVTLNLLSNAAKFTREGEVRLSAAVEGDSIVVRVADTGVGVPEKESQVIFETFRQIDNTLTDKPRGTGLGLPISHEIIAHHGGELWLEPNPGGGSVFAYSIPVGSRESASH